MHICAFVFTMQLLHEIRIILAVRSPSHFVSDAKDELFEWGTQFEAAEGLRLR